MFPVVNGSSAFQINLYCMERKKQIWRKAGEGSWEWGVPEGQVLSHKMIYAEGHEFVPKEDSFIWFPCSILPGRLRLCCRHASECNQQEIYGLAKRNLYSGKTVRREMKSSMTFLSCDAGGLSAVILR